MRWSRCWVGCNRTMTRRLLGLAVAAALALGLPACGNFKHLTEASPEGFSHASTCGDCHVAIYREWSESAHARAFVSAAYREETDDYRVQRCLGCHAPAAQAGVAKPEARAADRSEGITCVSCHLDAGKLSGPLDPTGMIAPHPVGVIPDRYRSSRMCGRCHEGTFGEWDAAAPPAPSAKPACQQCHMPATVRKVTQPTGGLSGLIVALERPVEQRQHRFAVIADPAKSPPVAFSVSRAAGVVRLTMTNRLPHRLPTGDYGVCVLTLQIDAVAAGGATSPLPRIELAREQDSTLAAGGSRTFDLAGPQGTTALHVRLVRPPRGNAREEVLADEELPLP